MKIPKTIRIGGIDYKIIETKTLNDGHDILHGCINYGKSTIELNPCNQEYQALCCTLWHEVIHGIIKHTNMNVTKSGEEAIVDTIAKGIYQVLEDNPEIYQNVSKGKAK